MKKFGYRKIILALLLILIISTLLFFPRTKGLNSYTFVDETFYLKHAAQFYWAVANRQYADTYLIVHPGVTTLWLGASAFRAVSPEYKEWDTVNIADLQFRQFLENNGHTLLDMQVYTRLAVVLFNALCLIVIFLLCWRLFGKWPAAGAILLVGFDPYYFDFSRFLHVDGILSTLMLLALLAFIVYLKEGRRWWLALSAIAVGLSALTKVIGLIVLGVIGLIALLEWWRPVHGRFTPKRSWGGFGKLAGAMALLVLVAALTIFALWPALWAAPIESLRNIFTFTLERSSAEALSPMFFNGEINPTGVFGLKYFYFYPLTYLWHSSPITLVGLVLLLLIFVARPRLVFQKMPKDMIWQMLLYVLTFTVLITLSKQKFDRYLLPAYLPLDILAALGWWYGAEWLAGKIKKLKNPAWLPALVMAAAALANAFYLVQVFPYGISYFNPLMGGPEKAPEVLQIGHGEGLDLAAEYMLTIPDKRNLTIYTPYASAFGFHFDRKVQSLPFYENNGFEQVFDADYVILYLGPVQRGMSGPVVEFLADKPAEHTVVINGIEYAWIYHMSEFGTD